MEVKILSVNISETKGTVKKPVGKITLSPHGVAEDADAGHLYRQVSLLGKESVDRFSKELARAISFGEFAENLTTEGLELSKISLLDRFVGKDVELEVTQIGIKCHSKTCTIFQDVGDCVMPREGISARVIRPGSLKPGDILNYKPRVFRFHVVTLSDRASKGHYEDRSGPRIIHLLNEHFQPLPRNIEVQHSIIPDDAVSLRSLIEKSKDNKTDILITTGGTGVGPRDITIETIQPMLDKEIPGIMEMIRMKYGRENPNALLSRGVAGFIGDLLVYTLPGSVKAVNEYMEEILKTMQHLLYMRYSLDTH